jgi:hypothetical protein
MCLSLLENSGVIVIFLNTDAGSRGFNGSGSGFFVATLANAFNFPMSDIEIFLMLLAGTEVKSKVLSEWK